MAIIILTPDLTASDVVSAAGVSHRCVVVEATNPADAAGAVVLHQGAHARTIGQSATWRHETRRAGAAHAPCLLVETYWDHDKQAWSCTVSGHGVELSEARLASAVATRRRANQERAARQRRELAAAEQAQQVQADAQDRDRILAEARQLAEEWAPARSSVWEGQHGRLFAGRWDAPYIPGSGPATETREVRITDGVVSLG